MLALPCRIREKRLRYKSLTHQVDLSYCPRVKSVYHSFAQLLSLLSPSLPYLKWEST
jgi:hypothetical protein